MTQTNFFLSQRQRGGGGREGGSEKVGGCEREGGYEREGERKDVRRGREGGERLRKKRERE